VPFFVLSPHKNGYKSIRTKLIDNIACDSDSVCLKNSYIVFEIFCKEQHKDIASAFAAMEWRYTVLILVDRHFVKKPVNNCEC